MHVLAVAFGVLNGPHSCQLLLNGFPLTQVQQQELEMSLAHLLASRCHFGWEVKGTLSRRHGQEELLQPLTGVQGAAAVTFPPLQWTAL